MIWSPGDGAVMLFEKGGTLPGVCLIGGFGLGYEGLYCGVGVINYILSGLVPLLLLFIRSRICWAVLFAKNGFLSTLS